MTHFGNNSAVSSTNEYEYRAFTCAQSLNHLENSMPFEQLFARLLVLTTTYTRILLKCQQMAGKFILSYIKDQRYSGQHQSGVSVQ